MQKFAGNIAKLDLNVPAYRYRTQGQKSTIYRHHAWAVRALHRARKETNNFWNMKMAPEVLLMVVETALMDEFDPKPKRTRNKQGSHLQNMITALMHNMKGAGST